MQTLNCRDINLPDTAHPHSLHKLPAVRAVSLQPILFSQVPASIDAPVSKLVSSIEALPQQTPELSAAKKTLSSSFAPFLKSHLPLKPDVRQTTRTKAAKLQVSEWSAMTSTLLAAFASSPINIFPLIDLWRLLVLDQSVSEGIHSLSGPYISPLNAIQSYVATLVDGGAVGDVPRPLLLTSLRLSANAFAYPPPPSSSNVAQQSRSVLVASLLHSDASVRTAAASLAFNIASARHAPLRSDYWEEVEKRERSGMEGEEESDVELVCALLEAVERETESEEVGK